MDAVKNRFNVSKSSCGANINSKKWFSATDELKRKGGYTQYNESFARIGKYIQASEVGRFHFYCAACEADFSLAKMGPRAVERHVQSTRHKKIVAALGMNPQEFNSSDSMSPLTSVEAMLASSSTCTNRNLFYDIDTSTPVDIFDVRSGDTVPGVCAPLQSVLQTTMASNESYARCGGTANVICGSETDLSLAVKKEVMVSDTTANNANRRNDTLDKNDPENSGYTDSRNLSLTTPLDGPSAIVVNENGLTNSDSSVPTFLQDFMNHSLSSEKEQQLFLLKAEILQMKKRLMRMKCEYYRKKIALVELMKQNSFCSSSA
ncbi:unnamed protein product [Enterobius vermicularis]|uniref:C2H2-type domain-containing protein n=1 Tax=Enterobius vermicularis TaxID=51028 RepID=A0A0N4V1K9_ENTVE|nr:unnamed protein product [Enterobius vermicularis]